MNTVLIFFALPIAIIIISAILQKVLNSPFAVAALIFAIFLVVAFALFDVTFLIATLAYTILAFITAFLVKIFFRLNSNNCICKSISNLLNDNAGENDLNSINNTLNEILDRINNLNNVNSNNANNNTCGGRYTRYRRF